MRADPMELHVDGIDENEPIPTTFAFCGPDGMGANLSPGVWWSNSPTDTASFAVTCTDPDVPSDPTDVNVDGRIVSASLPRITFAHWLLVDLASDCSGIDQGAEGSGTVAKGKSTDAGIAGGVRGANDFTAWFDGDADMGGVYAGYDGPCPPTNDELMHHYTFTVHALDVATLGLAPGFRLGDFEAAIEGHVLDSASLTATYTLNPDLA